MLGAPFLGQAATRQWSAIERSIRIFLKFLFKYFSFEISAPGFLGGTGTCLHTILKFVQKYWVHFSGLAALVMNSCLGQNGLL